MKIAAYCRVSTEKEEQPDSLAHQKEFFLEYAKKNGHGPFQLAVVKDISRVAGNTADFLQSVRRLKTMGINMIANMTSLGDSEVILTVFGAMAQEESGSLSKRVKWGKRSTRRREGSRSASSDVTGWTTLRFRSIKGKRISSGGFFSCICARGLASASR